MRLESPLRYPGGKASLSSFLADVIDLNDLRGCGYFEPYAGGAGAALRLLDTGTVSNIHLNDADPRIAAFWSSVLKENDSFIDRVMTVELSIAEWERQREISRSPGNADTLSLGFSTFYLNRCNRSGVIGAGPIGGYSQDGEWRLDVRFNRETLANRIRQIGAHKDAISISSSDALEFLATSLPRGSARSKVFVYLDPPYVEQARRLYLNAYGKQDHADVAKYLARQKTLPWVMSYDDCELVRSLYIQGNLVAHIPVKYSLNKKRVSNELLISPTRLTLPYQCRTNLLSASSAPAGAH